MERQSQTLRVKRRVRLTPEFQALWQGKETRTEWEPPRPAPRVAPPPLATTTTYIPEVSRLTRPVPRPPPLVSFTRGSNGASNPVPRVVRPPESSLYGYSRPLPKLRQTTTEPISVEPVLIPDVRYTPASRYTSGTEVDPELHQYDELSHLFHQMDLEIQRTKSEGLRVARRVITEPMSRPRRNSDPTNGTETLASRNILPSSIGAEHSRLSSVVHTPATDNELQSTTRESHETKPKSSDPSETKPDTSDSNVAKSKSRESSETKPKREESIKSELTPKTKAESKATTQREETESKPTTQNAEPEPPTQEEQTIVNTPSPPRSREADEEPLQGLSQPLKPKVKAEPTTPQTALSPSSSTKQTKTTDDDEDATKPQTTDTVSPSITSVMTAHRKSQFTDAGYFLVAAFIALYAARLGYNNIDNLVWLWQYRSWFNIPIV